MEIERKFLVRALPEDLERYPHKHMVQSYISRHPVIRLRKIEKNEEQSFILTVKGEGLSVREEFELPLSEEEYLSLRKKEEGKVLEKTRYLIPLEGGLTAELDIFEGILQGLWLVEVEFSSEEEMAAFVPPEWFGEDVSDSDRYHNSTLSM